MTDRATEARLALCDPDAVPRFRAALGRAIAYGADACIERDPWRTAEQQRAKKEAGFSDVDPDKSAHCHTRIIVRGENPTPDAPTEEVPASRAIHLVSRKHFYFAFSPALLPAFAVRVGAAALREGLVSGVLYGPRTKDRETLLHWRDGVYPELKMAILDERWREAEIVFEGAQKIGGAWDPLHIEWRPQ